MIDCTDAFFAEPDVPMVIAGLNDERISEAKKNIVSLPSAMVTQMLLPLEKVFRNNKIRRIVASAYISASVYGKEGMDELFNQTRKIFMNEPLVDDQQVSASRLPLTSFRRSASLSARKPGANGR